jgi:hypothetical protein
LKHRSIKSSLVLAAAATLSGCHRPSIATSTPAEPAKPAVVEAPSSPCPVVPVSLVMTPPTGAARTVLSLDASGRLDISLFEQRTGAAKLDANGCLVGSDGLWAEWAPHDRLWTPHEAFDVAGDCLAMGPERSLCIAADGKIEVRAKDRAPPPKDVGSMSIRGYGAGARCPGLLVLATFMAMMPSMAVADGHPARAPAPVGSRCGAFRRP